MQKLGFDAIYVVVHHAVAIYSQSNSMQFINRLRCNLCNKIFLAIACNWYLSVYN